MYGMADEPLLNLSLKNVAIKDALWEIEKQSKMVFVYNADDLGKAGKISVEIKGKTVREALDICLKNSGFEFPSEEAYHRFISLESNAANNTRKLILRGHTPVEVQGDDFVLGNDGRMPLGSSGSVLAGNVKAEKETAGRKIYPNDPCPCGSGKKYKKCCGRNK